MKSPFKIEVMGDQKGISMDGCHRRSIYFIFRMGIALSLGLALWGVCVGVAGSCQFLDTSGSYFVL